MNHTDWEDWEENGGTQRKKKLVPLPLTVITNPKCPGLGPNPYIRGDWNEAFHTVPDWTCARICRHYASPKRR